MKKTILELLEERRVILDGAMGSMLIDQGLPIGTPPESWNSTHPKIIQKIHKQYFFAGSDAVLTNTFGCSRLKLSAHKHEENIIEYNQKAVENARVVCPEGCYVGGDIGPSGRFLPPVGQATVKSFEENFIEHAKILSECEIDFFFVETMVDIKEAEAAVKAVRKISKLPVFASMSFQKTKRGYFTIMGNSVEQCINSLRIAGAEAIGANCTIGSNEMIDLIGILQQHTNLPIIAKPNAGKPQFIRGETIYPTSAEDFTRDITKMIEDGARLIGGCCGTNPVYIQKMAQNLREYYH